ncbi:hypothetical protein L207DRAFT_195737 [Hyaloscypha variabilis F]|uniref:Uncharacterized protein n=1 Tax=Hyaloscypha variabilis (strain UAMH 11265 / GT02V1 / F) TaxID=1149755 RepID=A0A2J6QXD4_HYAVF|nr:hypothetical protein L207DRAFT_195737 [Hyaloscypha variabilis F]
MARIQNSAGSRIHGCIGSPDKCPPPRRPALLLLLVIPGSAPSATVSLPQLRMCGPNWLLEGLQSTWGKQGKSRERGRGAGAGGQPPLTMN